VAQRARRVVALVIAPVSGVLAALPAVAVTAGVAAVVATAAVAAAGPIAAANAATGTPVLVLLQNGETTAPEAAALQNAGYSVTQDTPTQWLALTAAQFKAYAAVVVGDPSSGSCSSLTPTTATSGNDGIGTTWQSAVTGNLAIIGTAPALPGTSAATTLITNSVAYAAAGWNSSSDTGTGLYLSLNCDYSTAAANTAVPLLDGVEGISSSNGLTVQGSLSCSDSGTVNGWGAANAATFSGYATASLASGGSTWPSPSCPVEEAFDSWPGKTTTWTSGTFTPLAYDRASDATANFTASDGATGQPYILLGSPSQPAASLSPSTGGQVPTAAASGGSNPAVPGLAQPLSSDVNTESGDFTQSATDVSVPGFGPSLSFSRSYDATTAQRETQTGTPGPMGYGWTDNWASSLSTTSPTPGDIYTTAGLRTDTGDGDAPSDVVGAADAVVQNGSDLYIVDESDNHILEVPATTKTQWGRSMTAGKMYVVAGSTAGSLGDSSSGAALSGFLLNAPGGLAFDASGNMIIADTGNDRVLVVPAASGTYYGVAMTAGDVYRIAGQSGTAGTGGDAGADTSSYLSNPVGLAVSSADLYIADAGNNRVQEIYEGGDEWGQTMTKNDVYTVAGSSTGASGDTVSKAATSALLSLPEGVALDSSGNLYIADTANNAVKEVAKAAGTQWGISMTAHDLYDVAGSSTGASGTSGDSGKATSALLNLPITVAVASTGLYIADSGNNRVQEAALTTHSEWGISMTADDVYTVAGSSSGTCGYSGDGGKATSADMCYDVGISVTASTSIYIADEVNNRVREVNSADTISTYAGDGWGVADAGNKGPAVDAALYNPEGEAFDSAGDVFIADAWNNRIQEIAAHTHTQFGIAMTAGDVYTVAGNAQGQNGSSGDGSLATSGYLYLPQSIAIDSAGNLYIADSDNCRIQKIAASTGDMSTIAGSSAGNCGSYAGNAGAATSATLSQMQGIALDSGGDVFIADTFNNRVEEVYEGGESFGQTMTKGDIYNVAGTGTQGYTGNAGAATSAEVYEPDALGVDGIGNLYISDWGNNRIREVPVATGTQRGQSMTKNDIYAIAGNGTAGTTGDGGPATSAELNGPGNATVDAAGNLYISDTANNRVQEVPVASGTQWGQSMTANDVYTVVGSSTGASGSSGDGGPGTSARLTVAENVSLDPEGDVYVTDKSDNRLRELVSATPSTITPAPSLTSALYPAPGGITITEADGAAVTFYGQSSGKCTTAPYTLVAGQYCARPENTGTALTYNSSASNWTFTPQPGTSYTYNSAGQLTAEAQTDANGNAINTLTMGYGTPAPGAADAQGVTCPASVTVGGSATTTTSCDTITAPVGSGGTARTLVFGLASDSAGHALVRSVTDPMGRTWDYGYTGDDLTAVQDPLGNLTSYGYDTGNANPLLTSDILTVTQPDGQTGGPDAGKHATLTWNSAGQVTSVTDPMGFKTTYTWTGFNPSTGSGFITVADPDGNSTVYYYQLGTLAAQSSWTGSALSSEQDYVPDQSTASGDNSAGTQLDTATSDGDGNLTTTSYTAAGIPVTVTAPDGEGTQDAETSQQVTALNLADCTQAIIATATCASAPNPTPSVSPGGVITPPSSVPPLGVTWVQSDTDGNKLWSTTGVYEPGASTAAYADTTYQLFNGNSVTLNGTSVSCAATAPSPTLACASINADGVVTQLGYDAQGDETSTSTPDGNAGGEVATTTYGDDSDGEQTSTTSPDGNLTGADAGNYTTTTAYNADGKKTTVTQAGGTGATVTPRATTYGYDADGNQTTVEDARGYTTTTSYNANNEAALVTNPDGDAALTCYDGDGNVAQTVPAVGVAADSLTTASCPTSYPAGYTDRLAADATVNTYDAAGNKTASSTPAPAGLSGSELTSYAYDSDGNLIETTAPPASNAGGAPDQVTYDTYDDAGQQATQTTGYGTSAASTTAYCYDPEGDKTAVVAPDGNASGAAPCQASSPWNISASANPAQAAYQTTYGYDSTGEVVSTTTPATSAAPGGATTTSTYDPAGNMTAVTDPDGITTTYTYTPLNLTATASYSGSSAHSVTYTYDADRNQTGMTDGSGTSSSSYDPFGELTSATNGAGQTVTYGYDADGDNTSIGYPLPAAATWATSDSVSYGYDDADQLTSATDFNGNKIAITSTADGLPSAETLGSTGDSIITGYDQTDNPSAIALENSSSTLQSFTYADAPGGETLTEADTPSSSGSPAAYGYDAQGRVTSLTPGSGTASTYGFDASGNLTTLPGGAAGTYDDAGEITSSALAGTTTTYTYNADGERVGSAQGSTVTSATWNGGGQLTGYDSPAADMTAAAYNGDGLRTSDTTGGTSQDFAWNGDKLLMDGASAYIYAAGTTPAEQVSLSTGTVTYLVSDALGSVRGTVSSTGALTGTTSYDAWGNPSTAAGLTAATPFGYAGAYTDPDGLLYLINRYYDPATGQFISVDPYLDQTNAPYTYADGNPVTNTDPTGLTGLNDKPGVLGRSYCYHVVSAQHWNGQVCAQVYVSGLENTLAQAQVVFKVNSGDIYYAAVDTLALEACSNTGPHPGHPVDCKWGYVASSGAFYTDVKTFTVTTSAKFRAIYVTWFRAYAEGVTMVWTNGQYVANGSVYGYLEEDGNGG
jgi:RHS repeat-associated protein